MGDFSTKHNRTVPLCFCVYRKYVSFDGHFELVYNDDNVLLTQYNNPEDMGTYNYSHPDDIVGHIIKDVKPYGAIWMKWGNVPEHAGALYK